MIKTNAALKQSYGLATTNRWPIDKIIIQNSETLKVAIFFCFIFNLFRISIYELYRNVEIRLQNWLNDSKLLINSAWITDQLMEKLVQDLEYFVEIEVFFYVNSNC